MSLELDRAAGRKMSDAAKGVGQDGAYVIGGESDASLGLQPSEMSAARSCASLARALMARGRAVASADARDVAWDERESRAGEAPLARSRAARGS